MACLLMSVATDVRQRRTTRRQLIRGNALAPLDEFSSTYYPMRSPIALHAFCIDDRSASNDGLAYR